MYIKERTLDDLLRRVIVKLLQASTTVGASRGKTTELSGVLLQLTDPRARLSRTERKGHVFSCLGELLWYLARSDEVEFISYYVERYEGESEDGQTVHGAYGPRLFKMHGIHNQVENVLSLLSKRPSSRRAVIQLFDAADIAQDHVEIPCTCTLQFLVRGSKVHMFTSMRSNDAFFGLPHDVFSFTMLQEIVARSLGLEIGTYKHAIGSLHLYDSHRAQAQQYVDEGLQSRVSMPQMPTGDPWRSIRMVLQAESAIRRGGSIKPDSLRLDPYWEDLVRLLQVYHYFRTGKGKEIATIKTQMSSPIYGAYIEQKKRTARERKPKNRPGQLPLFTEPLIDV